MALDKGISQGKYWGGAQIPYWLYLLIVCFPLTGILGLDHLLLRSPLTFIFKALSFILLLSVAIPIPFWYFYDIAQAVGERENIEKFGIGIPYYGPIGIGAEMFINKDSSNVAPPSVAKPWIFMVYALLSIGFFAFPLNKLVIGDYYGCLLQLAMYTILAFFTLGISIILAVAWGAYDAYRVVFDTRGLFENGAYRMFPAGLFGMSQYFNKGALGPSQAEPPKPSPISATLGAMDTVGAAVVGSATEALVKAPTDFVKGTIGAAEESAEAIGTAVKTSADAATSVVGVTAGTAIKAAEAMGPLIALANKLPAIVEAQGAQKGGAILSSGPSVSSTVLLFSVALIALGGFVLYSLRKTVDSIRYDEADDPPPNPGAVRGTSKANRT